MLTRSQDYSWTSLNRVLCVEDIFSKSAKDADAVRKSNFALTTSLSALNNIRKIVTQNLRPDAREQYPILASLPIERATRDKLDKATHLSQVRLHRTHLSCAILLCSEYLSTHPSIYLSVLYLSHLSIHISVYQISSVECLTSSFCTCRCLCLRQRLMMHVWISQALSARHSTRSCVRQSSRRYRPTLRSVCPLFLLYSYKQQACVTSVFN